MARPRSKMTHGSGVRSPCLHPKNGNMGLSTQEVSFVPPLGKGIERVLLACWPAGVTPRIMTPRLAQARVRSRPEQLSMTPFVAQHTEV